MNDPSKGIFSYEPEVHYKGISAEDSEKIIEILDPFKKGYMHPLESHLLNSDGLRKYLGSAAVTEEIYADYRFHSKEIEDALTSIVRLYSALEMELQSRQLDTESQREYFNVFTEIDMDQAKIEFIKMLKAYEHLKEFNTEIRENWMFLKKTFEKIKVNSINKLFLEQVLIYKIYPRLELCEQTDLLLRRLAYILKIQSEEQKAGKWSVEGEYTSLITYNISTLFTTNLAEKLESGTSAKKKSGNVKKEKWKDIRESSIKDPYFLDTRGDELFNQHYLYTLNMNKDRVEMEERKIRKSMYIETHLGAEDSALRSDLIRKFISQAKSKDKLSEYTNFLHEYFDFTRDTLLLHFFDFNEIQKNIFCFHFGPVFFLKVVMHFMREGRTGFIHRHLQKDQMLRELPFEYLKFTLKDYWDLKVFQRVSKADRNAEEKYLNIISAVKGMWRSEQDRILDKIENDKLLSRYFYLHDLKALEPMLEEDISFLFYAIFQRFLGRDFLYIPSPTRKKK